MIMRIISIVLIKNEDMFIETVLRNILDFSDEIIVADDYLTKDRTPEIVENIAQKEPKIQYHRIFRTQASHEMIQHYAGTRTWIFAVDGDEIYDPEGLSRFRKRLEAGELDRWWCIFGNVLNCKTIDKKRQIAEGYLAPPSRSMTKLYNFSAIDSWEGPCKERLHGGKINFRAGYDASLRYNLHEEVDWDASDFRCLHTCFLPRSSLDKGKHALRLNITDRTAWPWWRRFLGIQKNYVPWKLQKYCRGEIVKKNIRSFFP
ncbi:MAG: glycosyltransferase, partial [Deltaproteobacteria bacterium]|nr:glycosyltransferase [Deltaproteobacteria bacterium]